MAITYSGSDESEDVTGGPNTLDWETEINIGTLTNGFLVVNVAFIVTGTVDPGDCIIKWDGVELDAAAEEMASYHYCGLYYLTAPANGTNTLEVDVDVGGGAVFLDGWVSASWYEGVNQTQASVLDDSDSLDDTGDPALELQPTQDNELLISVFLSESNDALTVGTGETQIANFDMGGDVCGDSYAIQTSKANQTMDWTGTDADYQICVASFLAAAAAAGDLPPWYMPYSRRLRV